MLLPLIMNLGMFDEIDDGGPVPARREKNDDEDILMIVTAIIQADCDG